MIDPVLQTRLLSLLQQGAGSLPTAAEAEPGPGVPLRLQPGQVVEARVLTAEVDGRVELEIEGAVLMARLERTLQPPQIGQRLALTVVRGGNLPILTPTADDGSPTPGPAASTTVNLSGLAGRIAAALAAAAADPSAARQEVTPVMPGPTTQAEKLVAPLRQALERSGLFYESHQAEWVGGQRNLDALRAEPQARLMAQVHVAGAVEEPPATPPAASGAERSMSAVPVARTEPSIAPAVAHLVDRQLETLSTQQILWSGQIWPGQTLEWRIAEREAEAHREAQSPPGWTTQLKLALPRLGAVEARLDLSGDVVRVNIVSATGSRTVDLREGEGMLRQQFEARGLKLAEFRVDTRDG